MDFIGILESLLGDSGITVNVGHKGIQRSNNVDRPVSDLASCPCCGGKGAFDTWANPCEQGHMHKKMDCPTCNGKCYFVNAESYQPCPKCNGFGAFSCFNRPCRACHMHFEEHCPTCNGQCYLPSGFNAGASDSISIDPKGLLNVLLGGSVPDELPPVQAEVSQLERAEILVRALVSAAKSDGHIDSYERNRIMNFVGRAGSVEFDFLNNEFSRPLDLQSFASSVPVGMEREVYRISLTAIDLDQAAEVKYLRDLARALRLPPDECEIIQRQLACT